MNVYVTARIVDDDEASHLSHMAEFYRMPVEALLSQAMEAGLAHAETAMLENEQRHAEVEAAMQAFGLPIGEAVH